MPHVTVSDGLSDPPARRASAGGQGGGSTAGNVRVSGVKPQQSAGRAGSAQELGLTQSALIKWRHFIGGASGGMVGATVTCPLEVVKTVLQSKEQSHQSVLRVCGNILRSEGVAGFWRGLGPMVLGVVPARAIYFATYDGTKAMCRKQGLQEGSVTYASSAVTAGVATCTLVNPIWVVKTRVQLAQEQGKDGSWVKKGSVHTAKTIFREEGWRAFFKGLVPSYWGITESALQFVLYEHLKKWVDASNGTPEGQKGDLRSHELLLAAGFSKFVASVATYPHEVIRTRMRERNSSAIYPTALACVRRVWAEEGLRGMYGGMMPHLMRVVPNTAIIFITYEFVSKWLENHHL